MTFWSTVISFLVGLIGVDIMIFVHELGHFIAARACGITVESVSLGLGPVLFSFNSKKTIFRICLIPFGGSTKMLGKDDLLMALKNGEKKIEKCEDGSLYSVSPWKRIVTYLSGPLANIILSVILYTLYLVCPVVKTTIPATVKVSSTASGAAVAGIQDGETVLKINGTQVNDFFDIKNILSSLNDENATIETDAGIYTVCPVDGIYGFLPYSDYTSVKVKGIELKEAISLSVEECILDASNFLTSLFDMVAGREKASETLGGVFSASESIGTITRASFKSGLNLGIRTVLYLIASVSVSMGIANMLPITALDGGLILISLAEGITKKTLSPKAYVALQTAGLIVIFIVIPVIKFFN